MERHNTYTNSIILKDFRAFYKELLLLKARAFQGIEPSDPAPEAPAEQTLDTPPSADKKEAAENASTPETKEEEPTKTDAAASAEKEGVPAAQEENLAEEKSPIPHLESFLERQSMTQEIRAKLETVLTGQYKELGSTKGGYAARYYEEAQYIMVSLADETFINLNWAGKEEWEDNLLESLMYNTQDAGDKFFENLDLFLDKSPSAQTTDMAALYLIALGLGFKGKYRDPEFEATLSKYKERLYRYITSEDPALLHNQAHLFPESYTNIIGDRQTVQMPNVRAWWLSLSVIGGIFVILSSIIWLHHMQRFSPLVDALEKWAEV